MTSNIANSSQCYGLYTDKNKIIGFIAIIHFPSIIKNLKKVHRLVILPDYQGIGLGSKLLDEVAKIYSKDFDVRITTSAKNLVKSLVRNKKWILKFQGRTNKQNGIKYNKGVSSRNKNICTFKYIGR